MQIPSKTRKVFKMNFIRSGLTPNASEISCLSYVQIVLKLLFLYYSECFDKFVDVKMLPPCGVMAHAVLLEWLVQLCIETQADEAFS
jgi:hypothetical protein